MRNAHTARISRFHISALLAAAALLLGSAGARAADVSSGWGEWWLPPDHSAHGAGIDSLFNWIFWITMITFIIVEVVLVVFLIKYRYRPEKKKAVFTHGNTRLEMTWTVAPAVILAVLALASKKVWDNYRYSPTSEDPSRAQVLVIGQQFKWNIIYPGPDGKLGRYLIYPKPGDARWSNPDGSDKPFEFPPGSGHIGPAGMDAAQAFSAIKAYMEQVNPLGKDFADPDGKDDSWTKEAGTRELVLPKGRPIEVQLSSKDVIHDFFLPNFRVKLDAVPGMRGHIYFTAMMSTKEREVASRKSYKIDEIARLATPGNEFTVVVTKDTPGTKFYKPRRGQGYQRYEDKDGNTIARDGDVITPEIIKQLKDAGISEITAFQSGTWELVCEELCGANHYTMKNVLRIVDSDEYDAMKLDKPYRGPSSPVASAAALSISSSRTLSK